MAVTEPGPSRLRVLGPIEVDQHDGPARLRGQQALLFAHLVGAYPRSISSGELEHALWGDHPPSRVDAALRVAITRLRNKIGKSAVEFVESGYRLAVGVDELDSTSFERILEDVDARIAEAEWDQAERSLARALALWRGLPFANLADTFSLEPAVQRLVECHERAQEVAVDLDLRAGRYELAAAAADGGTRNAPFRERRQEQLMLALHLCGRTVEALRVFQQHRSYLADEVGLTPGESIADLEVAIVQNGPLDRWNAFAPSLASSDATRRTVEAPVAVELGRKAQLPLVLTSYVLRPELSDRLVEACANHRLVTIVGPPGSGKSRVTFDFARTLEPDSVYWIDLIVEDAATVFAAFASALDIAADDDLDEVARAMSARVRPGMVVIFDNCELVIEQVRVLAEKILYLQPEVRIIATSRRALQSPHESLLEVGPMRTDQAAHLLAERSEASRRLPTEAVERLVHYADNLPLSIELLATRLRTHTAAEILAGDTQVTGDPWRLDASLEQLEPRDVQLFCSLGVMAGFFDLHAAAALLDADETSIRSGLDRLVTASLLKTTITEARPRYFMVKPLRQAALARLGDDRAVEELRHRHVEHYAAKCIEHADQLMGKSEESAVHALQDAAEQVEAAWRFALSIDDVESASMLAYSWWTPTLRWLRHRDFSWPAEAARMPGFEASVWRLDVLAASSMAEWARGKFASAVSFGEAAVDVALKTATRLPLDARFGLISGYASLGEPQKAFDQLLLLIEEAQERNELYHLSGGYAQIAFSYAIVGESELAEQAAATSLKVAQESQNTSTLAFAQHAIALANVENNPDRALRHAYESLRLSTRADNRWLTGWTTGTIATLYRREGRHEECAEQLAQLLEHWRSVRMEPQLIHTVLEAALLFDAIGNTAGIATAFEIANAERVHHPLMPSDTARVEDLRTSAAMPLPGGDEQAALEGLSEALRAVSGVAIG